MENSSLEVDWVVLVSTDGRFADRLKSWPENAYTMLRGRVDFAAMVTCEINGSP